MTLDDWDGLISNSEVGDYAIIIMRDRKEAMSGYTQVRRAEKFGYKICLTHLHDEKYYFEKLAEGDRVSYVNRRRGWKGE